MTRDPFKPEVVRVSQEGQATILNRLREKCNIDTPSDVLIYGENERIIIEPLPSAEDLHGIHAGDHEPGEILTKIQEQKNEEKR